MTGEQFWLKAAQRGSYMTAGDPGACLYGFDERGEVQSEEHRAACIRYLNTSCRAIAKRADDDQDVLCRPNEHEIEDLIAYLRTAPIWQQSYSRSYFRNASNRSKST